MAEAFFKENPSEKEMQSAKASSSAKPTAAETGNAPADAPLQQYGAKISADVLRAVGIPISIGIADTKTLAKIGSKFAKRYKGYKGCCLIDTDERRHKALSLFPIEDVWGIGRQIARKLDYMGIRTAAQFAEKKESWVRSHFNVTTVRTWKELNGESCISIEELPQKKSICTSRSFADEGISDKDVMEEAVANFAVRCTEKLRRQGSVCQGVTVFAWTSRFNENVPEYTIHHSLTLPIATNAQDEIVGAALAILRANYPKPLPRQSSRPPRAELPLQEGRSHPMANQPRPSPAARSLRPYRPPQAESPDGSHQCHQPQEWSWHHPPGCARHRVPIRPEARVYVAPVHHRH